MYWTNSIPPYMQCHIIIFTILNIKQMMEQQQQQSYSFKSVAVANFQFEFLWHSE